MSTLRVRPRLIGTIVILFILAILLLMVGGNLLRADTIQTSGLSDAQIMRILVSTNDHNIAAAQLAVKSSSNNTVRAYAIDLQTSLAKSNEQVRAMASKLDADLDHSPTSDSLKEESSEQLTALQGQNGNSFDHLFIDDQIKDQAEAMQNFDTMLMPGARNPDLRYLLIQTRALTSQHLAQARQVGQTLKIYYCCSVNGN